MTPQPTGPSLSHVRADGTSHMVDVSAKQVTAREATAASHLRTREDVIDRILSGDLPKGEALGVARIAGISAAKRTHDLIPLCHPLPLTGVSVDFTRSAPGEITIHATVRTTSRTGVEMEALTAASLAALTLYDMIKAVDHLAVIGETMVLAKSGGKSGDWARDGADPGADGDLVRADGADAPAEAEEPISARVIIASTRAADGTYEDRTGPILTAWLDERGYAVSRVVVPDGPKVGAEIQAALAARADLVLTSGGTGITPSDVTPEQSAPYILTPMPGISEAIRRAGEAATPLSNMSRGLAGMNGRTLIVNLPGSRGGVRDGIAVLSPLLDHLWDQRDGGGHA
ncbi:MAG: bifunctional molybdenum cofactor biosynthesis protein MoaC/MoaB [Dermabacter sp.]|nr:bifunctional molybdenum cofactor biosynthesis protein MoaC/MoaB [Dermabacter sp.]